MQLSYVNSAVIFVLFVINNKYIIKTGELQMAIKSSQKLSKKYGEYFEKVSFVIVSLFALLPFFSIFAPMKYGPMFITLSGIGIVAFFACLIVYLYNYFLVFPGGSIKERTSLLMGNLKQYFSKNKHALLFLIIYACVILSTLFADDKTRALSGTEFRPDGLLMHTSLLALFVFSSFIKNPTYKKTIFGIYIVCFILQAAIMIQQYYGIIGSAPDETYGVFGEKLRIFYLRKNKAMGHFFKGKTGSFYNLNHLGYYIGMCAMLGSGLFLTSKKISSKIFSAIFMGYAFWTLVLNNSFGVYLAVLVAIIVMGIIMFFRAKAKFITAFFPLIAFIIVNIAVSWVSTCDSLVVNNFVTLGKDLTSITKADSMSEAKDEAGGAGSGRWKIWVNTVEMIGEKPVLGYGPDNLYDEYDAREVTLDRAHNEILERAVSTGIFSAVCYVLALAYLIWTRMMRKDHLEASSMAIPLGIVLAYVVSALTGVFLFYTACHFFIFIGMMTDR